MKEFRPGDKVIKRHEQDASKWGTVMELDPMQEKPGYVAVYFKRHVWIKPEHLMHFEEWEAIHAPSKRQLRHFWTR